MGMGHGLAGNSGPPILSPLRVVAAVCVIAPFVAMLWLSSYDRGTPKLLGFPYFYWYQLIWVVITAVLMAVAYLAVSRDASARRTAKRDGEESK